MKIAAGDVLAFSGESLISRGVRICTPHATSSPLGMRKAGVVAPASLSPQTVLESGMSEMNLSHSHLFCPPSPGSEPGDRLGRYIVLGSPFFVRSLQQKRRRRHAYLVCQCECGSVVAVNRCDLVSGHTVSCGCFGRERRAVARITHGFSSHHLYRIFRGMKDRCCKKEHKAYRNYGGRGIRICNEWLENPGLFIQWGIQNGWERKLQIDRIDNDGDYTPENCRFVTSRINNRNRRSSRMVTAFGETKCISAWCDDPRSRVNASIIQARLDLGWSHEDAITRLSRFAKPLESSNV